MARIGTPIHRRQNEKTGPETELAATMTGPVLNSAVPSHTTATGWSTAPVRTRPAMP